MPFDEENNQEEPSLKGQKIGLKKVSSQTSIFDSLPKKPSPEAFEKKVKEVHEKSTGYKSRAADLAVQFNKAMSDKTLKQNKGPLALDVEKELLLKMVQLAIEINNDELEEADMGSMSWITLLLKTCFSQRDRINYLEYSISEINKKIDLGVLTNLITKEVEGALDKKKNSG